MSQKTLQQEFFVKSGKNQLKFEHIPEMVGFKEL